MISELFIRNISMPEGLPEGMYYAKLPAVRKLAREGIALENAVTFFVGENGSGKSTLIEAVAIAAGFNPEGGSVHFNFSTADSHSDLHAHLRLVRGVRRPRDGYFLRAESFYNVASNVDSIADAEMLRRYGGKSLHTRSHGESFLALVENRFGSNGLYILDEPEAALSPTGIMRLMVNMQRLCAHGCQFIIATHSPILMAFPGATVYELGDDGMRAVPFDETDHYRLTRRFLEDPEGMLRRLMGEE